MPIAFMMAAKCDRCGDECQFLSQPTPAGGTLPQGWQIHASPLVVGGKPASAQLLCTKCVRKVLRGANTDASIEPGATLSMDAGVKR